VTLKPGFTTIVHKWAEWNGVVLSFQGIIHGIKEFFYGLFAGSAQDKSIQKTNATYQEAIRQLEQKQESERQ